MLELVVRLLDAIERGEDLGELEAAARRIAGLRLARGGERLRGIAVHHVGARQHPKRRRVPRIVLQRLLGVFLRALRVVGGERELAQERQRLGRVGRGLERPAHGHEHRRGIRLLAEQRHHRAASGMAALLALLLEESDAPAVLMAMSGALEPSAHTPETLTLLGELALAAYDAQRAQEYAEQALQHDPGDAAALRVLARAYVVHGDASQALATARKAKAGDSTRGGFELAEVLASLDRIEEAHHELEHLRTAGAPAAEVDRRLALLAFASGDLKEARQRFMELLSSGQGTDTTQLYLADITARDGDPEGAIAAYRRLYDSSVALSARSRAASLLLDRNARSEALALLDDYAADHPEDELELTLAKARLLADHGEADTGLALLASALERHPQHPSIEYDRAVILEQAGHVHESVQALEQMLSERPDDPALLNALGYTLADHTLELPHAEGLIRRALAVMPDNPAALDSLGWVRFRAGDSKSAVAMLQHAYTLGHDAEIAAHWGEALWASGQRAEARRVWAAALARDPDSKPLKATLKRFLPDAK